MTWIVEKDTWDGIIDSVYTNDEWLDAMQRAYDIGGKAKYVPNEDE
jgi:hypothetical protein